MKRYLKTLAVALLLAGSGVAIAQIGAPVGQTRGGALNQGSLDANSDSVGFNLSSFTPSLVVAAGSTTQATFDPKSGVVLTGQVITTKTTVITTCSGTTGVTLPAVQRFETITLMNRSGGSCLVWPTIGATVETALGTNGAANAPFTMLTNTDINFRPVSATAWYQ